MDPPQTRGRPPARRPKQEPWGDSWGIRRAIAFPWLAAALPWLRLLEGDAALGGAWWLWLAFAVLHAVALGIWLLGELVWASTPRRRLPLRTRFTKDVSPWLVGIPAGLFIVGFVANLASGT
jgi:hypothetical protein